MSPHLAAELLKQAAKINLQHIPYKGTNDLIADLLTGRVPIIVFLSPLIAKQHVMAGELLALGITSAERSPTWRDTPTIAEGGVPGYAMEAWYAVLAPKDTPRRCDRKTERGNRGSRKIKRMLATSSPPSVTYPAAPRQPRPKPTLMQRASAGTRSSAPPAFNPSETARTN